MNRKKLNEIMQEGSRLLEPMGLVCVEAEWLSHERILRIYVDSLSEGSGIDLDACARASHALNSSIFFDEISDSSYSLEVSSPGIERPLRREQEFRRFIGKEIEARVIGTDAKRRKLKGVLFKVEGQGGGDTSVSLETAEGVCSFPLSNLVKATLVYHWGEC